MPETDLEVISLTDPEALDAKLTDAKLRFNNPPAPPPGTRTDLASTQPLSPTMSDHARELQQLRADLQDSERALSRAQKAAADYRDQLQEAMADIAAMKTRWYAAEKARNAVSSQREVDSTSLQSQLVRVQKELERTQQLAQMDMERAANRIRLLEERLEVALANAAVAETSRVRYRNRSNVTLSLGIAAVVALAAILVYPFLPHPKADLAAADSGSAPDYSATGTRRSGPARSAPAIPLESLSQKPFTPRKTTKNLTDALGTLDRELKKLPGLDAQQVLEQISKKQSKPGQPVCQFAWSNGKPSMVFDQSDKGSGMEKWAVDISRCADAVEQSH